MKPPKQDSKSWEADDEKSAYMRPPEVVREDFQRKQDNQRACERPGDPPNDDICIEGMRKYAERGEKQ